MAVAHFNGKVVTKLVFLAHKEHESVFSIGAEIELDLTGFARFEALSIENKVAVAAEAIPFRRCSHQHFASG